MNRNKRIEISGVALRNGIEQPNLNGPQRTQYAKDNLSDEQWMIFNNLTVARRITIPLCNRTHVYDTIQVLRQTAKELQNLMEGRTHIEKNSGDKRMEELRKITMAHLIVMGATSELKRRASPSKFGFNDGSFMGVR